eukprot:gene27294-35863_t
MTFNPLAIFHRDERHDGVRRINIYALRLLYILMFFMLGNTVWTHILTHRGAWQADDAMAWSVWAAFATLAGLGIVHPLKMLPVVLLEIFYKALWLILVAYPLWSQGRLAGAPEEYQTMVFIGILFPIVAVPWGYVFKHYVYTRSVGSRATA